MKKSIWIKADQGSWEIRKKKITDGLECGVDTVLVDEDDVPKVRELGDINIAAFFQNGESDADILVVGKNSECDATISLPRDFSDSRDLSLLSQLKVKEREIAAYVLIKGKEYEKFAAELGKICDHLIVIGTDWKVIPLENLIAALQKHDVEIIAGINSSSEAKVALETLEHGSDGVLLETKDLSEIKRTVQIAEIAGVEPLSLTPAKITRVKAVGMGDRVCVDTCSLLSKGEGMLIGSQSNGLFLIHGETEESPYVSPRPFRVNAGAVHAYVYVSGKTK
ncbi:MAG: 3-dehydroquinate synthase II, partial [Methanocellales archaeon]|nr:3-dehydroquinate synthase II [Methanocellales archaeon]